MAQICETLSSPVCEYAQMLPCGFGLQLYDWQRQMCVTAGLFDANKEQQRLEKQQVKLEKDLQGLQGTLKNPKFMQNAKPEVVQEAQQAAAEGEHKLAQIQQKMGQIAHLV